MDDSFEQQPDSVQGAGDELQPELGLAPLSSPYPTQGEGVVNYFFPVEIVIGGSLAPREREVIQAEIFQDLHDAIVRRLA